MDFPQKTQVNQRIPKRKFYENTAMNSQTKKFFTNNIVSIFWRNKLSADMINLSASDANDEIEVIELTLESPEINEKILNEINRAIPYKIIFSLLADGKEQLWVGYQSSKEGVLGSKQIKYFHTDWQPAGSLSVSLKGLDFDKVWENIILQIGGIQLEQGNTLDEQIEREEQKARLQKEIARLERMARAEKQPKKKFELVEKIRVLKSEERHA